jgi:hypothetical protein
MPKHSSTCSAAKGREVRIQVSARLVDPRLARRRTLRKRNSSISCSMSTAPPPASRIALNWLRASAWTAVGSGTQTLAEASVTGGRPSVGS